MIRYTIRQNTDLRLARRDDFNFWDPYYSKLHKTISRSPFPLQNLNSLAEIKTGYTPAKDEYSYEKGAEDAVILKVANLSNSGIKWAEEHLSYVSPAFFEKSKKGHLQRYDILLLGAAHQRRYIGKRADIVDGFPTGCEGNTMCVAELVVVRANLELVNPYYLLSVLRTPVIRDLIAQLVRGQTGHLYPDDLKKLEVPIPSDIEVQKKLARISLASDQFVSHMLAEMGYLQRDIYEQLEKILQGDDKDANSSYDISKPASVTHDTFAKLRDYVDEAEVEIDDDFLRVNRASQEDRENHPNVLDL